MRILVSVTSLLLLPSFVFPDSKDEQKRLGKCNEVLEEILNIPDSISQELLDKAKCVVVIPSVKKFAFGFGGSYGKGAMLCRSGADFTGSWGAPAMYRLEGASIGFQLGGSATDFLLLVMNEKGANSLLSSKVKLGADAMAAAGPKGRSGEVATDAYMRAEILTYSRSRGLFAGVSLKGSTLRQDNGANEDLYGQKISAREIVLEGKVSMPSAGRSLVELLQKKISTAQRGEKPAIQYDLRDKPTDWSRLSFWISIPLSCLFFLISLWVTVRKYKKQ
ncbi:MAG: lipid-binding SYLF domain-containing protein [Acidobacteria bacterium]|nr:lipid-binding SYLF domain-containing protein [Acidobacteriota bacterium]